MSDEEYPYYILTGIVMIELAPIAFILGIIVFVIMHFLTSSFSIAIIGLLLALALILLGIPIGVIVKKNMGD